jgi:ADP-dependent NAD(P)H-hydrate dehydratase / NAD(P)H-hydrate epimerase
MTPFFNIAQIRDIEQTLGPAGLMEKAGMAAAMLARDLLDSESCAILVVAGPGNNGGDAFVAARHLKQDWHRVTVVFAGNRAHLPTDAAAACDAWLACGGAVTEKIPSGRYDLVIDGLFGIGLTRPVQGRHAKLIRQMNALGATMLSLDIPSGLCADTGRRLGETVRADHTLTYLGLKPGLFTLDGPDHVGLVHLTDLGVEKEAASGANGMLLDKQAFEPLFLLRRRNSHKGDYGSVAVLGGAKGMTGAALLAARAALLIGTGRVYAGLLAENAPAVDLLQPELMLRTQYNLPEPATLSCVVSGPGMGRSKAAAELLTNSLQQGIPHVLDADALHLAAMDIDVKNALASNGAIVLTPHPGEAATLLGSDVKTVQSDRIAATLQIAQACSSITVLKGCGTVIALPDGRWFINPTGNPGMSSAGMGDVLAGIIGGLIGQGMVLSDAALLGVYLHGAAADELVKKGVGPLGLTASEVALETRNLLNRWMQEQQ